MDELFGEPIHVYTREQAIRDGVLVPTGTARLIDGTPVSVCFTANLMTDYEEVDDRIELIRQGLTQLSEFDDRDDDSRRFRVVVEHSVWAIWDGDGITFLRPEDY